MPRPQRIKYCLDYQFIGSSNHRVNMKLYKIRGTKEFHVCLICKTPIHLDNPLFLLKNKELCECCVSDILEKYGSN